MLLEANPLTLLQQIYANLSDWRNGHHQKTDFSSNLLGNIYEIHMTRLALLKTDNPGAYHRLKAKLLRQVR